VGDVDCRVIKFVDLDLTQLPHEKFPIPTAFKFLRADSVNVKVPEPGEYFLVGENRTPPVRIMNILAINAQIPKIVNGFWVRVRLYC
jgi:hypothetical protein